MMRLSPRLICFIGASSVLLRSALAAQDDSPDEAFSDLVRKINKDVGADTIHPEVGHCRMLMACDQSGESGVILRVFENGLRTISSAKDADDMCNITDIEYQCKPNGVGKLQQQLVVTGTKCRKTYGKNARGEHHMYYTFEEFHHTMTFNIESIEDVEKLRTHFVTACEFKIGKFKMVKAKDEGMQEGLYDLLRYSRSDNPGAVYKLATKPSKKARFGSLCAKVFSAGMCDTQQAVFKRADMMLCRNEEGKPVAAWGFDDKNNKCQWIELRDSFNFLRYKDANDKFVNHPFSGKVMKQYPKENFQSMLWDTEYVIKGRAYDITLAGKGKKVTADKTKERIGFLHFVRDEDKRCAPEFEDFATYISKSGLFDNFDEYKIGYDFGEEQEEEEYEQVEQDHQDEEKTRELSVGSETTVVRFRRPTFLAEGADLRDQIKTLRKAQPAPKAKHGESTFKDAILEAAKNRKPFQYIPKKDTQSEVKPEWTDTDYKKNKLKKTKKVAPKPKSAEKDNQELIQQLMEGDIRPEDVVIPDRRLRRRLYASELSL